MQKRKEEKKLVQLFRVGRLTGNKKKSFGFNGKFSTKKHIKIRQTSPEGS